MDAGRDGIATRPPSAGWLQQGRMARSDRRPPARLVSVLALLAVLALPALAALLHPATARAQSAPARVRAHVAADSVKVGQPFSLSLVAEHNFSTEVRFPEADAGPLVFGDLEVLSRSDVAGRYLGSADPGMRRDSVTYRVATFALDSARVPAIPVEVVMGSDTVLVSSQRHMVPVTSTVPPGEERLRGLAPLASFPQPLWPWVLLGLAALAAVAGLVYWWRQRGEEADAAEPVPAPEPDVAPYEAALERLDRLEARSQNGALEDPGAVKPFYVDLSDTLRTYLADRLGVAAPERTTREIVTALEARPDVPKQGRLRVHAVLEVADLVKFADTRPTPSDHQTALREARTAITTLEKAMRPAAEEASPQEERS